MNTFDPKARLHMKHKYNLCILLFHTAVVQFGLGTTMMIQNIANGSWIPVLHEYYYFFLFVCFIFLLLTFQGGEM